MTDKAPPAGWVVQVIIPAVPAEPGTPGALRGLISVAAPSFKYFNVAIAGPSKAMEATTKHAAEAKHREVSVVRALSSEEIAELRLKDGEVKPA